MKKEKSKKKIAIIIGVLVLSLLIAGGVLVAMPEKPPQVLSLSEHGLPTDRVNLIAHRGFSAVAPENSASAFIEAGKAHFFAAECDIQLTKDEVWVVNHDSKINRMTNGRGKVAEMTFEEISQYNVDEGHHSEAFPDQKIITLDDFLLICAEYDIVPQIEIKSGNNRCLEKILEALDKYEGMREKAIIISFDMDTLKNIRKLDDSIEVWYLVHEITDEAITFAKANNFSIAFNGNKYIKDECTILPKVQEENIKLASWTIDDPEVYKQLYDLGVRNFTTNRLVK